MGFALQEQKLGGRLLTETERQVRHSRRITLQGGDGVNQNDTVGFRDSTPSSRIHQTHRLQHTFCMRADPKSNQCVICSAWQQKRVANLIMCLCACVWQWKWVVYNTFLACEIYDCSLQIRNQVTLGFHHLPEWVDHLISSLTGSNPCKNALRYQLMIHFVSIHMWLTSILCNI